MGRRKGQKSTGSQHYNHIPQVVIKPKTKKQSLLLKSMRLNDITFAIGSAGGGKTFCAISYALKLLLEGSVERIILVRPAIEAGEKLGFLPGKIQDKMEPYLQPVFDIVRKHLGPNAVRQLLGDGKLEISPLAYMRGRSQPLWAKIQTLNGTKMMGEIAVNDIILGKSGTTRVTAVFPQGEIDYYRVTFSDGTTAECSEDHLWSTRTRSEKKHKKGFTTKTLADINKTLKVANNACNHEIPLCEPVGYPENKHLIHPYVLGVLLGDAYMGSHIQLTNTDDDIIARTNDLLASANAKLVRRQGKIEYGIVSTIDQNLVLREVERLGLRYHRSWEKFIPTEYKYDSIENRIELLRGLIDTDGSIFTNHSGKSRTQFYSTSETLSDDVRDLVLGLGGTCTKTERKFTKEQAAKSKGHNRSCFVLNIVLPSHIIPAYCKRKVAKYNPPKPVKLIKKIELIGKTECQCISVNAQDRLYLTDNYIVTHNTLDGAFVIFDEAQNATDEQMEMFLTRIGEGAKFVICGDHTQNDLRPGSSIGLINGAFLMKDAPGVGLVVFEEEDAMRHELIPYILKQYREFKDAAKKSNQPSVETISIRNLCDAGQGREIPDQFDPGTGGLDSKLS